VDLEPLQACRVPHELKEQDMGAEPKPAAMKIVVKQAERRQRRSVSLRAVLTREDQSVFDIYVLDLSYEGCGIETPVDLKPGEAIKLSVLRRGVIEAHVRWYEKGYAGVVFDGEQAPEKEEAPRRSQRRPLGAEVSLRRLGQHNFRVGVTDLSPEGCKVELVERPSVGEHMLIKFNGLEVLDAEVCWVEGFVAGLRFEKTIHPAVFELLLERLR
jgi:hypothetical protein